MALSFIPKLAEWILAWSSKKLKLRRNLQALKIEIEACAQTANIYRSANVPSPNYDVSTVAYEIFLDKVIAEIDVGEETQRKLREFYTNVRALDRGIRQAHDARSNSNELSSEWQRTLFESRTYFKVV